jgi:hypothetical protein
VRQAAAAQPVPFFLGLESSLRVEVIFEYHFFKAMENTGLVMCLKNHKCVISVKDVFFPFPVYLQAGFCCLTPCWHTTVEMKGIETGSLPGKERRGVLPVGVAALSKLQRKKEVSPGHFFPLNCL